MSNILYRIAAQRNIYDIFESLSTCGHDRNSRRRFQARFSGRFTPRRKHYLIFRRWLMFLLNIVNSIWAFFLVDHGSTWRRRIGVLCSFLTSLASRQMNLKEVRSLGYVLSYPGMYSLLWIFLLLSRYVAHGLRGFPLSPAMLGQESIVSSSRRL